MVIELSNDPTASQVKGFRSALSVGNRVDQKRLASEDDDPIKALKMH